MKLLSLLFPPQLPKIDGHIVSHHQHAHDPILADLHDDGILWVAYDVRRSGIERFEEGL